MSHSKAVSGLQHFTRLNTSVYIHEPNPTALSKSHPNLILICGWMNASRRHISKYTTAYEKLYPSARILAIATTTRDAAFMTHTANFQRIAPILEVIYTLPSNAKLLLHTFSNGGSWTGILIARKYQEKTGKPFAPTAVILDSAPGRGTGEATVKAFAVALPRNVVIKAIGIVFLHLFFLLYMIAYFVSRKPSLTEKICLDLNVAVKHKATFALPYAPPYPMTLTGKMKAKLMFIISDEE